MDNTKELTHISLCAGYGGIDLGLKRAIGTVRTIAFSEIESFPCQNLVAKMELGIIEPAPVWTNLKTFPWEQFRGKVDVLSGGFPCQPFSSAGKQAGDQDPRHLWPHIVRGVEICRPSLLFFENVAGILGAKLGQDWGADIKGTPVLLHILRELERREYTPTWGVFSASEVGAPHHRKRIFIFAQANELQQSGIDYISSQVEQPKLFGNDFGAIPDVWPGKRGEIQYVWEPPRTISRDQNLGDTENINGPNGGVEFGDGLKVGEQVGEPDVGECAGDSTVGEESFEPEMGRGDNGVAYWMGISKLYESFTDRTDELRLLGNGVVPATAERAFKVLWKQVNS